jgi:hypothetical protein
MNRQGLVISLIDESTGERTNQEREKQKKKQNIQKILVLSNLTFNRIPYLQLVIH